MSALEPLALEWLPREPPLEPVAVLARDDAVRPLARATHTLLDEGATLRLAHAPGRLLVLGAAAELPWADGVVYLGDDDGLLVPTTVAPSLPADLVRLALARTAPAGHLLAVVHGEVVTAPRPRRAADLTALRLAVR